MLETKIHWQVSDYCTGGCTYCPKTYWGGEKPRDILEYVRVTKKMIDHYTSLNRRIIWYFTGGDPLEMFDFPMVLKMCKEANGNITIDTNGGKLWMDWWAIEPHVDYLNLTYHYWQNPNLIKFILQTFIAKGKSFSITVPIRPDFFEKDFQRAELIEQDFSIPVGKQVLFNLGDSNLGFDYTEEQLIKLDRPDLILSKTMTYHERLNETVIDHPVFTGKLCNAGIETLKINNGWVRGSDCNSLILGKIWDENFELPSQPHRCRIMYCGSGSDQQITKFD